MTARSSRRRPYPDDMLLGKVGMRLVPNEQGMLIGKRTETLERQVPTEQSYDSAPVYKERTFAFRPRRGLGEQIQSSHGSRRYRYALNVWVHGGLFGKGPLGHTITPLAGTGSIADFVEALQAGSLAQFILAGRYVLRRVDDSHAGQTVSRDFGAGVTVTSGVRFRGAYAASVDGLYVATSAGQLWQYNGAAWTQAVLPAGFLPTQLEVVGDELWAADGANSVVRKVTTDPLLAGSWGGPILVGNPSQAITAIRQVDNRLFVFKSDGGIFTLNGDGSDNDLFPGLRATIDATNGQRAAAWLDAIWLRIGESFYRLEASGGATISPVGPERLTDNTSEVRGPVQAFAGYGTIAGFAAIYNAANGASYLLSYGDWQVPTETSEDGRSRFVDQWDGALVKWAGKRVSAMRVSRVAPDVAPDTRLYVGFTDGTWDWIKLVPHPLGTDSGAEFTTATSTMYAPLHTAMFQADWKNWRGFSIFGLLLDGNNTVQLRYRTDPTAAYTVLGGGAFFTSNAQRIDPDPSVVGMQLDLAIDLISSSSATSPLIEGVAIHEQVRPRLQLDLSGSVDARDYAARRDGSTSRTTGDQIREAMFQAASVPGTVTLVLPDETYQGLSIFSYQERLLPRPRRAWVIDWAATQYRTITIYGTIGRLTGVRISDLIGVHVGGLKVW